MKKAISLALIALAPAFALADQGGSEAHGGDAVVCFSEQGFAPVANGQLTAYGRAHIKTAVPLDLYRASLSHQKNPRLAAVMSSDYEAALSALHVSFGGIPKFHVTLLGAYDVLGDIETKGFATEEGLPDVADSGLAINLPQGCALIQAAARQGDQILYDPAIWTKFTPFSKAVLQLHEELYYVASDILKTANGSSVGTQLLIAYLLTEESLPFELATKLGRYGFKPADDDRYVTFAEWSEAQKWLNSRYLDTQKAIHYNGQTVENPDRAKLNQLYQEMTNASTPKPLGVRTGTLGKLFSELTALLHDFNQDGWTYYNLSRLQAGIDELARANPAD